MIGKVIAGLICGAAAAIPGRFMLQSIAAALAPVMGGTRQLEDAVMLTPFAVAILVIVLCVTAPSVAGAWLRGCLIVAVVAAVTTLQALQCYGFDWLFSEMFNDRIARDATTAACLEDQTPLVTGLIAAAGVAAGLAALFVWRGARRDVDL